MKYESALRRIDEVKNKYINKTYGDCLITGIVIIPFEYTSEEITKYLSNYMTNPHSDNLNNGYHKEFGYRALLSRTGGASSEWLDVVIGVSE